MLNHVHAMELLMNKCVRLSRLMRVWMLLCGFLWMLVPTGCSGCDALGEGEVCAVDEECGVLSRCVQGQCISALDVVCVPACGSGQACQAGSCVSVVSTCTAVGQVCDFSEPVSNNFYCIDWDGINKGAWAQCSSPCDAEGNCAKGSSCFLLTGLPGETVRCGAGGSCPFGRLCVGGQCEAAGCQPSECEGLVEGEATCVALHAGASGYEQGARCFGIGNEASYCIPAGSRALGELCVGVEDALQAQDLSSTCGTGLTCVDQVCRAFCTDDAFCSLEGESCLFLDDEDLVASGVGFCGTPCTAFALGSCPESMAGGSQKCFPVTSEQGYCVPSGGLKAFDSCIPGTWGCQDGLMCHSYRSRVGAGIGDALHDARCLPLCNLTVAPMGSRTLVSTTDQMMRDATCPQPTELVVSYVTLVHLAMEAGPVDVYLDDKQTPWVSNVSPNQRATSGTSMYLEVAPGTHTVGVRTAGSSVLNEPLAEHTMAVFRDEGTRLILGAAHPSKSDRLVLYSQRIVLGDELRRLVHTMVDVLDVDVWGVPPGGSVEDAQARRLYARDVHYKDDVVMMDVLSGVHDLLVLRIVEGVEEPREEDILLRIPGLDVQKVGPQSVVFLQGTLLPDDGDPAEVVTHLELKAVPQTPRGGPRQLCSAFGTSAVFGMCEQVCDGPEDYNKSWCDGMMLSCTPTRLPDFLGWRSLCRPSGFIEVGDSCEPEEDVGECVEGAYCLEYGGGAMSLDGKSGRCLPMCVVGEPDDLELWCQEGQSCQPVDDETFLVGRCGFACEPDELYGDAEACPKGLASCKPASRLTESVVGAGDLPPVVEKLPSFCSASGKGQVGEPCAPGGCASGAECMFPRSAQQDLVSTLLSPYFGAMGQTATCHAQCDPFDKVASMVRCGPEETCLVNYPWSADVGHCAPVVERVRLNQPCTYPGFSCGEDSVCVVDGGAPFCLRLCEYVGGPSRDRFEQSTCPAGFECAPLMNDVGMCRAPGP